MAVSNEAIQQWWAANPGASDQTIANAMNQTGVDAKQLGSAIGFDPGAIQQRYESATGPEPYANSQAAFQKYGTSDENIQSWLQQNKGASDRSISAAMDRFGVGTDQMARATGMDRGAIQSRYDAANPSSFLRGAMDNWAYDTAGGSTDSWNKRASGVAMGNGYYPQGGGAGGGGGGGGGIYSTLPMQIGGESGRPSANLGMGGENPYLGQHAAAITNQVTQNLQRNILPNISSGAMSAGGFGGSRQGVVEANALNDANQGLSNALAGMYSNDWNAQQGRNLSQYGMDQSYNLGMGNLGLNAQNSTNNFYTAQRSQDLQAAGLGASLAQMGNQGYLGQGQGMYNIGSTYNNAPWATMGNYGQTLQPWGSNTGSASSTSSTSSNPWANAIGGALLGGTFKLL